MLNTPHFPHSVSKGPSVAQAHRLPRTTPYISSASVKLRKNKNFLEESGPDPENCCRFLPAQSDTVLVRIANKKGLQKRKTINFKTLPVFNVLLVAARTCSRRRRLATFRRIYRQPHRHLESKIIQQV
jgi:hypothetical protein